MNWRADWQNGILNYWASEWLTQKKFDQLTDSLNGWTIYQLQDWSTDQMTN